jgi:hypothetical protein
MSRRAIIHCLSLTLVAFVLAQAAAQPPRGGPGGRPAGAPGGPPGGGQAAPPSTLPASRKPPVRAFAADGDRWAWLKDAGEDAELYLGGPGRSPRSLARGRGWVEVALGADAAWVLQRSPGASGPETLLRVPLDGGPAPAVELSGLDEAASLIAAGGRLYWLENAPAGGPGEAPGGPPLSFLPAAAARTRLRCRESTGMVRTVAGWPAAQPPARGDLVGLSGDWAVVRSRRAVSTEFLRVALASGEMARLAGELGAQEGALHGDRLAWTAGSEEANGLGYTCVRALEVAADPGTPPETLTDWLPVDGVLLATRDALWFFSDAVYRLPAHLGLSEEIGDAHGWPATSDGRSLVLLGEPDSPKVLER